MGYSGTWLLGREGIHKKKNQEQLDGGVENDGWLGRFLNASVYHIPHSFSDHCPLLVHTDIQGNVRVIKNSVSKFSAQWKSLLKEK